MGTRLLPLILASFLSSACTLDRHDKPERPGPFWIEFVFFRTVFEDEPGSAVAVTTIVAKEDSVAGLVGWRGIHVPGDRIGWGYEGDQWTSRHRVWSPRLGRHCVVDFNTGAVVQRIRGDISGTADVAECSVDPDPLATEPCSGIRYREEPARIDEVSYVDQTGVVRVIRISRDWKRRIGLLCTIHGGSRPVRNILTAAERVAAMDQMAQELYYRAGAGWNSRNPVLRGRAQALYRRLLTEFAHATIVDRERSTIQSRAQAPVED